MRTRELFNLLKPRYEAAYEKAHGRNVFSITFKKSQVTLISKKDSTPTVISANDLEFMINNLNQREPFAEIAARKKDKLSVLKDGGYYWVRFEANGPMEIAKYHKDYDQLYFTNGSHCKPTFPNFIDTKRLLY